MGKRRQGLTRRTFLTRSVSAASAASLPSIVRAQGRLSLDFLTIPDPDGWHESLRLKGDWLVFAVTDGVLTGYGEASHSRDDERCASRAAELFAMHYGNFSLSLENLGDKERELAKSSPDFVTATALSGLNQALYDLLAKREQVPVWRLFRDSPGITALPLYATINRALATRTPEEYSNIVTALAVQGFRTFKCAPFEAVDTPENGLAKSAAGLAVLRRLREQFPALGIRVDFHERFLPEDFFALLPELERLRLDWIEEPFGMGPDYTELKHRTALRVAAGELFWGRRRFEEITAHAWADVIMPDVKHVGGFGPLLDVLEMAAGRTEVSPHNPAGPVSTAASLHAAAVRPETVRSLELAFDKTGSRRRTGEQIENGLLYLAEKPGWGIEPQ